MTALEHSLVLTGDARGLVAAGQQGTAAVEKLGAAVDGARRRFKSAEDSADVFTRALDRQEAEVDQLRANLDPLHAATRRLEAGQELLARAHVSGAISSQRYRQTLDLLEAQHRQTTSAIEMQTAATSRLTTRTAGGAGGMQNFSYQLQDVFTQVGMGVPLMISLGQQAPQLLSGFGAVGAILGVVAAGALPLAAAIFGLGYDTDRTKEKIVTAEDLITEALSSIDTAQATLRENSVRNLDGIEKKYGRVTGTVLTLMQAQTDAAMQAAMIDVGESIGKTFETTAFDDLQDAIDARRRNVADLKREISALEATLPIAFDKSQVRDEIDALKADLASYAKGEDLSLDFGIDQAVAQNILTLQNEIRQAMAAQNYDDLLAAIIQLRSQIQTIPDGPLRDMLAGLVSAEDVLRQALHTAEMSEDTHREIEYLLNTIGSIDVSSNLAAGAAQATRIADELGRAVDNALTLASQGVGGLERARINYEFREDPIGRAAALGRLEFDSRTKLPPGADSTIVNIVERQRRAFIHSRVEAERYNQQLAEWRSNQRSASRGGGGGGAGGRDPARILEDVRRQMDQLAPSYERDLAALEDWRAEALSVLDPAAAGYAEFAADVEFIFGERLAEAYRKDLANREDWASGVKRALLDLNEETLSWADAAENIVTKWSTGLEDQFVQLAKTGKIEVGDLVDYTLEQLLRLSYQKAIQPGLNSIFEIFSGAISGLFGGGQAAVGNMTQSHSGSTIGTGGVRRSYGAGAPLRADERLTVTTLGQRVFTPSQIANGATVVDALAMAASRDRTGPAVVQVGAPKIVVENHGAARQSGDIREESDGAGGRQYRLILADEVGSSMSRPGSGARRTLGNMYGVRPRGTRR